jgi:hypothetical protein
VAVEYDEEIGYETIVNELTKSRAQRDRRDAPRTDPFNLVKIHTGVGFTQSMIKIRKADGASTQGFQKGVQASLGIDLLSRNWFAEAAIRSFGEAELETNLVAQLKEFDLKIVYRSEPLRTFGYRAGLGLATRNLSIIEAGKERKFSTPSSIFLIGLDTNVSPLVTIGGEFSYRSALTTESDDRVAMDFALKLDAHF